MLLLPRRTEPSKIICKQGGQMCFQMHQTENVLHCGVLWRCVPVEERGEEQLWSPRALAPRIMASKCTKQ